MVGYERLLGVLFVNDRKTVKNSYELRFYLSFFGYRLDRLGRGEVTGHSFVRKTLYFCFCWRHRNQWVPGVPVGQAEVGCGR